MELSEQSPEEIQQQIEATREALKEKISSLEMGISDTYQEAKSSVKEKLEDVKSVFDVKQQIINHPIAFVSILLAAGYAITHKNNSKQNPQTSFARPNQSNLNFKSSLLGEFKKQVGNEFSYLGNKATELLLSEFERAIKNQVPPPFVGSVERVFGNLRQKIRS